MLNRLPVVGAAAKLRWHWRDKLPWIGMLLGIWAILPPYTGPDLDTAQRVEVVDHVFPGLVTLAVSAAALVASRRSAMTLLLVSGLVVSLAGVWMTATHIPLVAQAMRSEAPWPATLYHAIPSVVVLSFGLVWASSYWTELPK